MCNEFRVLGWGLILLQKMVVVVMPRLSDRLVMLHLHANENLRLEERQRIDSTWELSEGP